MTEPDLRLSLQSEDQARADQSRPEQAIFITGIFISVEMLFIVFASNLDFMVSLEKYSLFTITESCSETGLSGLLKQNSFTRFSFWLLSNLHNLSLCFQLCTCWRIMWCLSCLCGPTGRPSSPSLWIPWRRWVSVVSRPHTLDNTPVRKRTRCEEGRCRLWSPHVTCMHPLSVIWLSIVGAWRSTL